jgi:hypothetical protein
MKSYWFINLVQDFSSWDTSYMKYDVTHMLMPLKTECQRYGKGHLEMWKMKIKDANIFNTVECCIKTRTTFKKKMYDEAQLLYSSTNSISLK